ncbi:MAG: flagellar hook-basal body complex subunit FliE [Clostridiaceae bacterium]|nr:flagellar hook-basal body complex subunit FliE [Clostridiaceae bacterium]
MNISANQFIPQNGNFSTINNVLDQSVNDKSSILDTNNDSSTSFIDTLKAKLNDVNDSQVAAEDKTAAFVSGDDTNIHDVMIATEEAKMSLELAIQVRNKLVDAYQELNRMQL